MPHEPSMSVCTKVWRLECTRHKYRTQRRGYGAANLIAIVVSLVAYDVSNLPFTHLNVHTAIRWQWT